jgi:predicted MFS family arabinose efflux permease
VERRRFWLANGCIILDEIVYLSLLPLLPELAERLSLSKTEVGFLYAAYPLVSVVTALPAGLLSDRIGARRVLIAATALLMLSTIGFALAENRGELWGARALQGLAAGLSATAGMAIIASSAPSGRRGATIGLAAGTQGLSTIVGPALGGLLAPSLGLTATFALPAAAAAILLVLLLREREPTPEPDREHARLVRAIVRLLRSDDVRIAVRCFLAIGITSASVQTLTPLRLEEHGFGPEEIGVLFIIAALIGLVVTPFGGKLADRAGLTRASAAWLAVTTALGLALGLVESAFAIAGLFVAYLTQIRVGGTLAYVRGARFGSLGEGLAAGYGLMITAWSLGAAIGPIAAGAIADQAGNTPAYVVVALTGAAIAAPAARRLTTSVPGRRA